MKCSRCKEIKEGGEFGKNASLESGFSPWCLSCSRESSHKSRHRLKGRTDQEISTDLIRLRPDGVKVCRVCKSSLSVDSFQVRKTSVDGLRSECKGCSSDIEKSRRVSYSNRPSSDVLAVQKSKFPNGEKRCRNCNREKTLAEFLRSKWDHDGLDSICRICRSEKAESWRVGKRTALVNQLMEDHGPACLSCGDMEAPLQIDHVYPLVLGGIDDPINYQLLCGPCNSSKGGTYVDYRDLQTPIHSDRLRMPLL